MAGSTADGLRIEWRGDFTSKEANLLHAEAFETRVFDDEEWDWRSQVERHSLGWVTARTANGLLVGFVNVISDGCVHAWIQDTMVSSSARHLGVGTKIVEFAARKAGESGCEWLHVDFDGELEGFYFDACGFAPTKAGLLRL